MKSLVPREQLLVALGAAIGSNCTPCVETILPKARAAGLVNWELRLAIQTADFVRQKPAAKVLTEAKALVDGAGPVSEEPCPLDPPNERTVATGSAADGRGPGCCG